MTTSLFKLEFVLLFDRMIRAVGQLTFQHKCSYQADLDINYIFWGFRGGVCSFKRVCCALPVRSSRMLILYSLPPFLVHSSQPETLSDP